MHQYRDTLEHILHAYRSYQPDDHDGCEQIVKAFEFAKESHEGQVRKSGDSYITHPLASTIELMNARPDSVTIVSCLLHDTVDDGTSSLKEIRQEF